MALAVLGRLPLASAADLSTQSEMNYARDSATAAWRILLPFLFLSAECSRLISLPCQKAPCVASRIRLLLP